MIFLLDTNAFSDLMRAHPQVKAHLQAHLTSDTVVICPVVRGEILFGIKRLPPGKKQADLQAKANILFSQLPCWPLPETAADHYAGARVALQRSGLSLNDNDLWLAAMAIASNATLVTRDADFQAITHLLTVDWSV